MSRAHVAAAAAAGLLLAALLIAGVLATGSTFGQRCTALEFAPDSPAWRACVEVLRRGGR